MTGKTRKYIQRGMKIFLLGLVLQFFAHTYITFQIQRTGNIRSVIRLRKEILILVAIGLVAKNIYNSGRKKRRSQLPIKKLIIITAITVAIILSIGLFTAPSPTILLLSLRYSMAGFAIAILGFLLTRRYGEQIEGIVHPRYSKIIKILIIVALGRYIIIFFIPSTLEFFGYERFVYEGTVGEAPPAAYYTNINQGLERNQFVFERPTSRGFFLIAFWPLFFIWFIKNKSRKKFLLRTGIYGFNILITFSRAARIAWFLQTLLLVCITRDKKQRKQMLLIIIASIGILGAVTYYAKDEIIHRSYSNLGHTKHTLQAVEFVQQKPILGWGPGFAGPAAHHGPQATKYNPENQFLQIWLEYGIFGFLGRMAIYLWFHIQGRNAYKALKKNTVSKEEQKQYRHVVGISLGMVGLTIEGLFLHSFVDRMVIYPFMLIAGIVLAKRYTLKEH